MFLLFPLLFLACSDSLIKLSEDEYEHNYNYRLLKAYFYHPERIKKYNEYEGTGIDEMYESLEDYFCGANHIGECWARYTFYEQPEKADGKINDIQNTPKYYSFGFRRYISEDTLIVSAVYPISPAATAGLKKRDKLLFANEVSLTGQNATLYLNTDSLFAESTVFKVLRNGNIQTLPAMQKTEVQDPTVFLDSLEGIPFVRVTIYKPGTNDPEGTSGEFRHVLQEIKGAKIAIMDLRSNGGGSIDQCMAMAAELVPLNSMLVYDEFHHHDDKRGNVIDKIPDFARDYLAQEGAGAKIKWILLLNEGSASCTERFTAAVKYNRPEETIVIGQTSHGKGIGQMYTKTYLGGLAYITCLQTFYPDGKPLHYIGIIPDVQTDTLTRTVFNAALEAAHNFEPGILAKRSPATVKPSSLPPEHKADTTTFGMYKRVLFH